MAKSSLLQTTFVTSVLVFGYWVFATAEEPSAELNALQAEWRERINEISAERDSLHQKIQDQLTLKERKEREIRNTAPGAPVEAITLQEKTEYYLSLQAIKNWYSRGRGTVGALCEHLGEREVPFASRRGMPSYVEGFPAARTLVEIEPHTAKTVLQTAWRYDTKKLQFLVGALLNDLDGFELAKARLDIKIKELADSKESTKEQTVKAIINLQAIRKFFDKKDAFQEKKLGR